MVVGRSKSKCSCLLISFATLIAFGSTASLAQQNTSRSDLGTERLQLRVASFAISAEPPESVEPQEPQPLWRHTFGSERRAPARRRPVQFQADIVVLQGVTNLGVVRQMLPASLYRVVASRQILENVHATRDAPQVQTTAIAIRRDARLRTVAHEHMLELAEPPPGAETPLSAGIAMRVLGNRRPFWVLSVDLAQGCSGSTVQDQPQCAAAKRQLDLVEAWLSEKVAAGEAAIIAGRFPIEHGEGSLPGKLGQLTGSNGKLAGTCPDGGKSIARTYVLIAPRSRPDAEVTFQGHVEPVDKRKPEWGCALLADVSF